MQALARNNREGDGSAYAFFPSQFLQSPFLRCSHPKWTKTLDELITSFYKYMLFLGDSSTTFYVIIWKKLIYFTPLLLKNRTHIWLISGRKIPDLKYVSDNFFNKFSTSSFIKSSSHVAYYIWSRRIHRFWRCDHCYCGSLVLEVMTDQRSIGLWCCIPRFCDSKHHTA